MADWKERTMTHWQKIEAMAVRRFGAGPLAEEAALAVLDGLEENGWQRVSVFQGQSSFISFLLAVSGRLLEDFARKKFGRVRPPLWVRSFGGIWEKLFQALCLERLPVGDAVEVVLQRQFTVRRAEIEEAAYQLLARIVDCGMARGLEVAFDEESLPEDAGEDKSPHRSAEMKEQRELFAAIYQLILGQENGEPGESRLRRYLDLQVSVTAEEKLLLKLCYQDGLTVSEAGKMLGMTRFQAHGRMRRLLGRLDEAFARSGLDEPLLTMLDAGERRQI